MLFTLSCLLCRLICADTGSQFLLLNTFSPLRSLISFLFSWDFVELKNLSLRIASFGIQCFGGGLSSYTLLPLLSV